MTAPAIWLLSATNFAIQRAPARDVDVELGFHLEERVAGLIASGTPPERAGAQAVAEFGDVATVRAAESPPRFVAEWYRRGDRERASGGEVLRGTR
jgi:hypothetical protein